jgi:hypothetical protein
MWQIFCCPKEQMQVKKIIPFPDSVWECSRGGSASRTAHGISSRSRTPSGNAVAEALPPVLRMEFHLVPRLCLGMQSWRLCLHVHQAKNDNLLILLNLVGQPAVAQFLKLCRTEALFRTI